MAMLMAEKKRLLRKSKDDLVEEIAELNKKYRSKAQLVEDIDLLKQQIKISKTIKSASPHKVQFRKNSIIYNEGEEGDAVYIILRGKVEFRKGGVGKTQKVITQIGDGKMFGDCALYDNRPRAVSAVALNQTEAIRVTKKEFMEQLSTIDPAVEFVAKNLTERIRRLVDELIQQSK